jgi:hypothetical protein
MANHTTPDPHGDRDEGLHIIVYITSVLGVYVVLMLCIFLNEYRYGVNIWLTEIKQTLSAVLCSAVQEAV